MRFQSGLSFIELIAFMIIVSVGVVGILPAYNFNMRHSTDALLNKQMLSVAEAMLEEIVSKDFDDPSNACTPDTGLSSVPPRQSCAQNAVIDRQNYNDVSDYDGFKTNGIYALDGTPLTDPLGNPILPGFSLSVSVADAPLNDIGCGSNCTPTPCGQTKAVGSDSSKANVSSVAKLITVTVGNALDSVTLQAYRTCYDRNY